MMPVWFAQVSALANHVCECKDADLQLTTLQCLMTSPGSCLLDSLTSTGCLGKIMATVIRLGEYSFIILLKKSPLLLLTKFIHDDQKQDISFNI